MPRQRFIWPDIWTDPTTGPLSDSEKVFFIGAFSNADDEGRLVAAPTVLKAMIWPYDTDKDHEAVLKIRDSVVAKCPNMVLYRVNGVEYLAFRRWTRRQHPKYPKPSIIPAPPAELEQRSSSVPGTFPQPSGKPSETLPQSSTIGLGWDGMGRDGLGDDQPAPEVKVDRTGPAEVFKQEVHPAITTSEAQMLDFYLADKGMEPALVIEGIHRTAKTRTTGPKAKYLNGILRAWLDNKILTLAALEDLEKTGGRREAAAARSTGPPPIGRHVPGKSETDILLQTLREQEEAAVPYDKRTAGS
ncbi:MAG: DnaD domain-containing protein [Bacillota bacterium]